MSIINCRTLSLSLALAAMLGLAGSAMAAGPYGAGAGMTNLRPEQQELVNKLHEDFYNSTKATRQELISKRHELDAQLYSANPDEKKVQALTKEISDLRAKLYSARVSLKGKLIKEGITLGHGGYGGHGPGHGRGMGMGDCGGQASCGDAPCGGTGRGW